MTPRLNGSSTRPAPTAETPELLLQDKVASTPVELVVAVLTNDARCRCAGSPRPTRPAAPAGRGTALVDDERRPQRQPGDGQQRARRRRRCGSSTSEAPEDQRHHRAAQQRRPEQVETVAGRARVVPTEGRPPDRGTRTSPTGTLTQNTARQLKTSVRRPPTRSPSAPAAAPLALHAASAVRRRARLGCRVEQEAQRRRHADRGGGALQPTRRDELDDVLREAPASRPRRRPRCRAPAPAGARTGPPGERPAPATRRRTSRRPSRGSGVAAAGADTPASMAGIAVTALVTPSTSTNCTPHRTATLPPEPVGSSYATHR